MFICIHISLSRDCSCLYSTFYARTVGGGCLLMCLFAGASTLWEVGTRTGLGTANQIHQLTLVWIWRSQSEAGGVAMRLENCDDDTNFNIEVLCRCDAVHVAWWAYSKLHNDYRKCCWLSNSQEDYIFLSDLWWARSWLQICLDFSIVIASGVLPPSFIDVPRQSCETCCLL